MSVVPPWLRPGVESCSRSDGIYTSRIHLRAGKIVRTESEHRFEPGVTPSPPVLWANRVPGFANESRTGDHRSSAVRGEDLMEIPIGALRMAKME